MSPRRHLALAIAALAFAVPAPAFAQSAGDDQYSDPLQGSEEPSGGGSGSEGTGSGAGSGSGSGSGSGQGSGDAAPAEPSAGATDAGSDDGSAAAARDELPRTGFPAGLAAAAGGLMLLSGAGLHRTLRRAS